MTRSNDNKVSLSANDWLALVSVLLAALGLTVGGAWSVLTLKLDPVVERLTTLEDVQRDQERRIADRERDAFSAEHGQRLAITIERLSTQVSSLEKEIERLRTR